MILFWPKCSWILAYIDFSAAFGSFTVGVMGTSVSYSLYGEHGRTLPVLNLGFIWLPGIAKLSPGLAGNVMGKIGCLYES